MSICLIQERQGIFSRYERVDLEPYFVAVSLAEDVTSHPPRMSEVGTQVTKHVDSLNTAKIPRVDTLASNPAHDKRASFTFLQGRTSAQLLSLPSLFPSCKGLRHTKKLAAVQRATTYIGGWHL